MVKKISLYMILSIVFIFLLSFFLPKKSFVYLLQEQLQTSQIRLNFDKLDEYSFSLELQGLKLYLDKVSLLTSKESSLSTFIVYNEVYFKDIELDDIAKAFLPQNIEYIRFIYLVTKPLFISFEGRGQFGKVVGMINILSKKITLVLYPSLLMKQNYFRTLRYFKKNKNGELLYEYNY